MDSFDETYNGLLDVATMLCEGLLSGNNEIKRAAANIVVNAADMMKEQKKLIDKYHMADGFLDVHGWKWE
jgi:hypothetical protein